MSKQEFFNPDAVFVTSKSTCDEVLKNIYQLLSKKDYVKDGFLKHIIEREHNYPTGLTLSTLGKDLPCIAVPHTEGQFVKKRLIVPVSLKNPVTFKNMVNPEEDLSVKFLFMLLETNPDGQAVLLSKVMDFLAKTDPEILKKLFNCQTPDRIYQILNENFK